MHRIDDQNKSAILVVMQRLHEDDLCGELLRRPGWDNLNLRAIAEEDESWTLTTPFGSRAVGRKAGGL